MPKKAAIVACGALVLVTAVFGADEPIPTIKVPNLELMEVAPALELARKAGLTPRLLDRTTYRQVPPDGRDEELIVRQGLAPGTTARRGDVLLLGVRARPQPAAQQPIPPGVNPGRVDPRDDLGFVAVEKPPAPPPEEQAPTLDPVPGEGEAVLPIQPDPGINIDPTRTPTAVHEAAVLKQVLQSLVTAPNLQELPGPLARAVATSIRTVENELIDALTRGAPVVALPADRVLDVVVRELGVDIEPEHRTKLLTRWQGDARGRTHPELLDRNNNQTVADDVASSFVADLHQTGKYSPAADVQVVEGAGNKPVAVLSETKRPPEWIKKEPPPLTVGKGVAAKAAATADPPASKPTKKVAVIPSGPEKAASASTPDKVRVPRLAASEDEKGMNYRDAVALLARRGLKPSSTVRDPNPADTIHAQEPKAGSFAPAGSVVTLTLGILVPDLGGLDKAEAVKKLDALGLRSTVESFGNEKTDDPKLDGRTAVFGQAPQRDQLVSRGSEVVLTVVTYRYEAATSTDVVVPTLIGLSPANANAALGKVKLTGKVRETQTAETADPKLAGAVVVTEQSEEAGSRVAPDKVIEMVLVRYVSGTIVVPKLIGLSPTAAGTALKTAKLTGKLREARTEEVPEGTVRGPAVTEQSDAAGVRVPRDHVVEYVVTYYVPKNDPLRLVPGLVGLSPRTADLAIRQARLTAKVRDSRVEETDNLRLVGQTVVTEQSEAEGTRVPAETVIQLVIVQYKDSKVTVPKLVGQTLQAAEVALKQAGVNGKVRETRTAETINVRQFGQTVIAEQSEPAGTRIARDQTIDMIAVRYTEPQVEVPKVVGLSPEAAATALRGARLGTGVRNSRTVATTDPRQSGTSVVAEQSEAAGTKVRLGTVVRLDLVRYQDNRVSVPNLVGMAPKDAEAACRQLGLALRLGNPTTKPTADKNLVNKAYVVSQSVQAGAKVAPNTPVDAAVVQYVAMPYVPMPGGR